MSCSGLRPPSPALGLCSCHTRPLPGVWLCSVVLPLWGGGREPSVGVACSLGCRSGRIHQPPSLPPAPAEGPPGSRVRLLHIFPPRLLGRPLPERGPAGRLGSSLSVVASRRCLVAMPRGRTSSLLFPKNPEAPCGLLTPLPRVTPLPRGHDVPGHRAEGLRLHQELPPWGSRASSWRPGEPGERTPDSQGIGMFSLGSELPLRRPRHRGPQSCHQTRDVGCVRPGSLLSI